MVDGIELRLPYHSDPTCRARINAGTMEYVDMHLSHVAQFVGFGFLGRLDIAVVEVLGILPDGRLIPSSSVGNNKTWLDQADQVILEVNSWQSAALQGMHDIYYGTALPPKRQPIPIVRPDDRIGEPYLSVNPEKVIAVVQTNHADRNTTFSAPERTSQRIADHILAFLSFEVEVGRLAPNLLPLQSGVGNVAMARFQRDISRYRESIIQRPQEISNNPEVIRRLGVIAMNGLIEADIYGSVNSTHIRGTSIMNGIGGPGDFARNAYISIFMTPSVARNGRISCIVPMATHVDHTEHDVQVIVTEQGLADLRDLAPKERARLIVEKRAHPAFRPALRGYFEQALRGSPGKHTPHLLDQAFSFMEAHAVPGATTAS